MQDTQLYAWALLAEWWGGMTLGLEFVAALVLVEDKKGRDSIGRSNRVFTKVAPGP